MPTDDEVADAIRTLLDARAAGASICPSEAARRVDADRWRTHMNQVRAVAAAMVGHGEVEITQRGSVVDPATARGPVRIRRPRH